MELEFQNATIGFLKHHYRTPEFFFFFCLELDFMKIELKKATLGP